MKTSLIDPTTAAKSKVALPTDRAEKSVILLAYGLGGGESIAVFADTTGGWVPAMGSDGAAVTLTSAAPQANLLPGPTYGVDKPTTAGAAGVDYILV